MPELPPGDVSRSDVLRAGDAALLDGDVHRAPRRNALARELHELGLLRKGARDGDEG